MQTAVNLTISNYLFICNLNNFNLFFSETSGQGAAGNAAVNYLPIAEQDDSSSFCNTEEDSVSKVFDSISSKNTVSF